MPPDEAKGPSPRRWWHLEPRSAALVLLVLLGLEGWAYWSADTDYYLPDFFRPLVIGLILLFVSSGFLPWSRLRQGLRLLAVVVIGAILVQEARTRLREVRTEDQRVEITQDVLLRYRYRPGVEITDRQGHKSRINQFGLWDEEHEIPKPPDIFRIAILTGSIANDGEVPYNERFVRQLERELADAVPGKRVEAINVSCEGYNVVQQVRLLELVGLKYQPDVVVDAYMLTSAAVQNGGYRRIGNSFFLFRFLPLVARLQTGSMCSMFAPFHERYTFDLIVRNSFERLALLQKLHGFKAMVAVLPIVERFDDPLCNRLYDQVAAAARDAGLPAVRLVDAFQTETFTDYAKPNAPGDVCHPNSRGHARIAQALAGHVRQLLQEPITAP